MLAAFSHSEAKRRTSGQAQERDHRGSLDKERERPTRFHRAELKLHLPRAGSSNQIVLAAPTSSSRAKVPARLASSTMTSCSGLEAPFGDRLVHRRDPGTELWRPPAEVGYALRAEVQGEPVRGVVVSFRDPSPLVQPLGGVLRLDPELVRASTCAATAEGARPITDPGPCSVFPGGPETRHGG